MAHASGNSGLVRLRSSHGVIETLDRLERLLKERGISVFARIDFSGDAARAGLSMRDQQMLIFGSPRAGTPLMQAVPEVGIDLPLKALAWQDAGGSTWLTYNTPRYVLERHELALSFEPNLAAAIPLLEAATG